MAQPSTPGTSGAVGAQALPLPGADAFAPLLEHSLNGFVVLNAEGTYVWVSASMCNLLECTKEQLLGCALGEAERPAARAAAKPCWHDCSGRHARPPRSHARRP